MIRRGGLDILYAMTRAHMESLQYVHGSPPGTGCVQAVAANINDVAQANSDADLTKLGRRYATVAQNRFLFYYL